MRWTLILFILACSAALATGGDDDGDSDGQDTQTQEQYQEQHATSEAASEAEASAVGTAEQEQSQANEQQVNFNSNHQTPGRAFIGGGDSTADDQKVFAINGGWLTGSAGFRLDLTDKDARKLRRADSLRARGLYEAANELECSAKVMRKALGGEDACLKMLGEQRIVGRTRTFNDATQDRQIEELTRQVNAMREELARREETCDRRWQKCVQK